MMEGNVVGILGTLQISPSASEEELQKS